MSIRAHGRMARRRSPQASRRAFLRPASVNDVACVRLRHRVSAVQMVRRSDLCFTCSETLAHEVAGTDEFRILPLPEECSTKWVPKLVWHERGHSDPAMQWLRSVIISLVHEQDSGR